MHGYMHGVEALGLLKMNLGPREIRLIPHFRRRHPDRRYDPGRLEAIQGTRIALRAWTRFGAMPAASISSTSLPAAACLDRYGANVPRLQERLNGTTSMFQPYLPHDPVSLSLETRKRIVLVSIERDIHAPPFIPWLRSLARRYAQRSHTITRNPVGATS